MPTPDDHLVISGGLRDFVANVLGHTAGLAVREGERLRPLLPVESAGILRELMSLPRATGHSGGEAQDRDQSGGGTA